jgi:pimeloyl-ACP methyl ester carboxylesterase
MKKSLLSVFAVCTVALFQIGCDRNQETLDLTPLKQDAIVEDKDSQLRSVLVNDYEINYLDIGDGEAVVFVHGGLGDYRTWKAQMDAFSSDYRVIAISRRYAYPNKQEANDSNDYSVTPHAEDLAQLLKTLNLGPVHLVGHSYGAFTSLLTALEHPELLRSLTLGEPPVMSLLAHVPDGDTAGSEFAQNVLAPTADAFLSGNDEKAVRLFIGGVLSDDKYFSNASQEQKELMMTNSFGLRGVILTENPFPPLNCESVRNLQTPTLLIKGEKSPKVFGEIANVLAQCIEGSELAILPDASHGLEYENPVGFNRIVLEFIGKN